MRIGTILLLSALASGLAVFTGCGGGSSASASAPSPVYTGKTTPAAIASYADADTLTSEAVAGSRAGATVLGAQVQGTAWAAPVLPRLAQALRQVAGHARPAAVPAAGLAFQQNVSGQCGGYADFSGTYAESGGSFSASGRITANGFCSVEADGSTESMTGSLRFSMSGTDEYDFQFTMATDSLTVVEGNQTYSFSMVYQSQIIGGVEGAVTLTCTYQAPDGRTYKVVGYTVLVNSAANTLTLSGRFYDPDYGYVDVSTPAVLAYTSCPAYGGYLPTSGSILVTGANGAWGEFSGQDCLGYHVCYNLNDGSGTFCQPYAWQ